MTGVPAHTLYHRWLGWHALAMRRAVTVLIAGLIVALALLPFATWGMALVAGWDAAALTFLLTTWPIIIRADGSRAAQLAHAILSYLFGVVIVAGSVNLISGLVR